MPSARSLVACRRFAVRSSALIVAATFGAVVIAVPQSEAANTVGASSHVATKPAPPPYRTLPPQSVWIAVSVATLWIFPGDNRRIDARALTNPSQVGPWTRSLTYHQRYDLHGRVATQALLGSHVIMDGKLRGWRRIRVPSQVGKYFPDGIIGWVPARQLSLAKLPVTGHFAAVRARDTELRRHDATHRSRGMRISFGTRLPVSRLTPHRVWVHMPGWQRTAWLDRRDVVVRATGRPPINPTPRNLIAQAKKFRGLPFIWAGMSSFGFDCSGFAMSMYRMLGVKIPRDSGDQALIGRPIRRSHLRRGDLVFFSADHLGAHHTAIYAGHGLMIQAPHTGAVVSIVRLKGYDDDAYYGARRILGQRSK